MGEDNYSLGVESLSYDKGRIFFPANIREMRN